MGKDTANAFNAVIRNDSASNPRSIYSWWREIWLEKVSEVPTEQDVTCEERKVA